MAKPPDIVRVLKWETSDGGDAADDVPWPDEINPTEDAPMVAGIYGGESGKPGVDKICAIYRENDKWYFEDTDRNGAGRQSLDDLATHVAGGVDLNFRNRFLMMGG